MTVTPTAYVPWLVLLKTSVREKRAYAIDANTVKLYWFDSWAARDKFVPCSILTTAEAQLLPELCALAGKPTHFPNSPTLYHFERLPPWACKLLREVA